MTRRSSARLADSLHSYTSAARLSAGAQAPALPEEAEDKLLRFIDLLSRWNRVYNLTAIGDPAQMLTHHVLDSLSIAAPLDAVFAGIARPRVLDVGTGA